MSQALSSSGRKYSPILKKLIAEKLCVVSCEAKDIPTIMAGVKKEKVRWVRTKRWPVGKALKIEPDNDKVTFRMITDTSVNNL